MKPPAYVIKFPDGVTMRGRTPTEVIDRIARVQMTKVPVTHEQMKRMLSDRAWVWTNSIVNCDASDLEFLIACAQAKLFTFNIR